MLAERDTWEMIDPQVVVLEDYLELRSLLLRGLREEGFQVTTAGSGAELLALLPGRRPDALVVEIGLPDADGRDVVQALRAHGSAVPVIFLGGDSRPRRLSDTNEDRRDARPGRFRDACPRDVGAPVRFAVHFAGHSAR